MVIRGYLSFFVAIAIALSLESPIDAQNKTEPANNLRERFASEWSKATLVDNLSSTTEINDLKFSPNGRLLASVGASQISLWNIDEIKIQRVLPGHYASDIQLEIAPTAIAFSPDSRFLATSTWSQGLLNPDRSIIIRDVATGEEVLSLADGAGCRQVLFAPQGDKIYGACESGVTVWSFPDGEELFSFDTEYPVEAIALSPDGRVIATVDANVSGGQQGELSDRIQLWQLDASEPKLLNTLENQTDEILRLEFTADGKRLVASSYDGKIDVWDWQSGKIQRRTSNLYSKHGVFSLNPNSQLIAGNFHGSTFVNLNTGLPSNDTIKLRQNKDASPIAFSKDAQLFASVNNRVDGNSAIALWSLDSSATRQQKVRDNYRPIPVGKYWSNQKNDSVTAKPSLNKPASLGSDPQAIALAGLGLKDEAANQDLALSYPEANSARVTLTQGNLADDSVRSIRYLLEFAPYGAATQKQWQIVWAGEQFQCQSGRGHQDWSSDLCQ